MKEQKGTWGGKRAGAGRPKSENPKIVWAVKLTTEEREYLKECLKKYRDGENAR